MPRASKHVLTLLLSSGLALLLSTGSVHADAAGEARTRYERAIKFYDDGVYDAALVELTRAYELNPSYRIMYNIAQTRLAMRDYPGAIEAFQRYLREGGGQVSNDRVTAVRTQLAELQQRVGKLTVETDVPESEILVDDVVVGSAPLSAPVVVMAGVRRITVRHPDFPPQSQRVSLAGGEQARVTITLRPRQAQPELAAVSSTTNPSASVAASNPQPSAATAATPIAAPATPLADMYTQPEPHAQTSRTPAYVATALTGALAATAVVLGAITLSKNSDLKDRRSKAGEDPSAFNKDRDAMTNMAHVTDVFALATLAAAGITTWLWLREDSPSSEHARGTTAPQLGIAISGAGAQLRGKF